jgi:dCMP deaminase
MVHHALLGEPHGLPLDAVAEECSFTERQHCVRTTHAEQNAICQAARYGIALEGATLYCKMESCGVCAMLIISVGIPRVVARRRNHAARGTREMFAAAGVELAVLEDALEAYSDQ